MAPSFPYPADHWLGQPSNDPRNHSGCYGGVDQTNVRNWQGQARHQGYKLDVDGCYGPQSENVCRQIQARQGLAVDGDVGPRTWAATFGQTPPAPAPGPPGPSSPGWRGKSRTWHEAHLGLTEQPAGSNCDARKDGIRHAQDLCANGTWLRGQPWCGVWAFMGLYAAGKVKPGIDSWLASVSAIEDRARAGRPPFTAWTTDGSKARVGDLVVLFGRGVHVGTIRSVDAANAYTWEGNTSSGTAGSQSNGGGSFRRTRSRSRETYGYALVRD
jgi:peptidoglycan hydrolase-like protein with peptidoglycan-binding domain